MSLIHTGPVEEILKTSSRADLRALCNMDNDQLLSVMDQQIDAPDDEYDDILFRAAQALLSERDPITHPFDEDSTPEPQNGDMGARGRKRTLFRRGRLRVKLLVALCTLAILGSVVALANGINPVQATVDLGGRLIHIIQFGPSGSLELHNGLSEYTSLEAAIDATDIDALRPTWIPSDLALEFINVAQDDDGLISIDAFYQADGRSLAYHVNQIPPDGWIQTDEKNEEVPPAPRTINEINCELYYNMDQISVRWTKDSNNYLMFGTVTEDELVKIIKSIK